MAAMPHGYRRMHFLDDEEAAPEISRPMLLPMDVDITDGQLT